MFTNNFAQPTPNAIPHDRAPERARRDKSGAKTNSILCRNDAEQNQLTAVNTPDLLYLLELRGAR